MIYRSFFPPIPRHCRSLNFSFSFPWPGSKFLRPSNACSIARRINSIDTASEMMVKVQRSRISFHQIQSSIVLRTLNASGLGLGMRFTIESRRVGKQYFAHAGSESKCVGTNNVPTLPDFFYSLVMRL